MRLISPAPGARPLISVIVDLPTLEGRAGHPATVEDGGISRRTSAADRTLLCHHHHHRVHDDGWKLERLDDGGLRFTGTDQRVLTQPPPPPLLPLRRPPKVDPLDRAAIRARLATLRELRHPGPAPGRAQRWRPSQPASRS